MYKKMIRKAYNWACQYVQTLSGAAARTGNLKKNRDKNIQKLQNTESTKNEVQQQSIDREA